MRGSDNYPFSATRDWIVSMSPEVRMARNTPRRKAEKPKAKAADKRGSQRVLSEEAEETAAALSVLSGATKKIFRAALIRRLRH